MLHTSSKHSFSISVDLKTSSSKPSLFLRDLKNWVDLFLFMNVFGEKCSALETKIVPATQICERMIADSNGIPPF